MLHGETWNPTGVLPMCRPSRRATTSTPWRVALSPKLSSHAISMPRRWRSVDIFARNLTALGSKQFRRSRKIGFRIALRQSGLAVISAGFKFLARLSEWCRQKESTMTRPFGVPHPPPSLRAQGCTLAARVIASLCRHCAVSTARSPPGAVAPEPPAAESANSSNVGFSHLNAAGKANGSFLLHIPVLQPSSFANASLRSRICVLTISPPL